MSRPIPYVTEAEVFQLPLPTHSFLRAYVEYAMQCTDAAAAYHIAGGLAVLTQTVPIDYHWVFATEMYTPIYTLAIGPSSVSRKSEAVKIARKVLELALPNSVGEVPGSKEILVDQLRAQPRQLVVYPEFGTFLSQAERGYLNPLKTTYTEAWDCTPLGRALVKKKDTEAKTPRLSLLCGSTLEYMERHTEPADWTGGFMARFLTFYADRERFFDVPPGAGSRLPHLVSWVQHLEAAGHFGAPRGECLGFDAHARELWKSWCGKLQSFSERSSEETAGAVARSSSHAIRVALLLAWDFGEARSGRPWYITYDVLDAAVRIVNLHLKSVMRVGENLASNKDMKDRRSVLNAIPLTYAPDGTPQPRPVHLGQITRTSKLLVRRCREILETLMEEGVVRQHIGVELAGAWYIRTTPEEAAQHGYARGTQFQEPALPVQQPAPTNVIPIGPYLPQSSNDSGASNTTSSPSTSQDGAPGLVTTFE